MTAEALQLYAGKLKDGGVVVLHISNRYLDLDSVLGATLPLVPELKGLIVSDDKADGSYAQNTSTIAVFAKDQTALDAYRVLDGAQDFHARRALAVDGRRFRYSRPLPFAVAPIVGPGAAASGQVAPVLRRS